MIYPSSHHPPEPALHCAARCGNVAELDRLIAGGADIDAAADLLTGYGPYFEGLTPLQLAAGSVDGATAATLRWLLAHGADLHAVSAGGVTAAWYAAGDGLSREPGSAREPVDLAERLRLLLDAGLDPNETADNGRSLLVEASGAGGVQRVRLLLERGAIGSPKLGKFSSFAIPLFAAARSGSAECVRLLLDAGVDPNSSDDDDATALFHAGSADAARALVAAGVDLAVTDRWGRDALQEHLNESVHADEKNRLAVARVLAAAGADLERRDEYGHTRLYGCAFARAAAAVELLLELGAQPRADQPDGDTPLHAVAWQGETEGEPSLNPASDRIIVLLAAAGVPVDQANANGRTPLHEAAAGDWGNATAVRALLRLGAAVDPLDAERRTPLMGAAEHGELECVRALLEAGANARRALKPAREHRECWREIVAEKAGSDAFEPYASLEQKRETEPKALADAAKCLRMIEEAICRRRG